MSLSLARTDLPSLLVVASGIWGQPTSDEGPPDPLAAASL